MYLSTNVHNGFALIVDRLKSVPTWFLSLSFFFIIFSLLQLGCTLHCAQESHSFDPWWRPRDPKGEGANDALAWCAFPPGFALVTMSFFRLGYTEDWGLGNLILFNFFSFVWLIAARIIKLLRYVHRVNYVIYYGEERLPEGGGDIVSVDVELEVLNISARG